MAEMPTLESLSRALNVTACSHRCYTPQPPWQQGESSPSHKHILTSVFQIERKKQGRQLALTEDMCSQARLGTHGDIRKPGNAALAGQFFHQFSPSHSQRALHRLQGQILEGFTKQTLDNVGPKDSEGNSKSESLGRHWF